VPLHACPQFFSGQHQTCHAVSILADQGIKLTAKDINVEQLTAEWAYRLHIWPHLPSGSGDVQGSVGGCTLDAVATIYTLPGGHLNASLPSVDIEVGGISLHFSGGITAWILDLLKGLLKGVFKNAIAGGLAGAMQDIIATDIDGVLAVVPTHMSLPLPEPYNVTGVDISVTTPPTFTPEYFGLGIAGKSYLTDDPTKQPPFTAPTNLSLWDARTAEHSVQISLSTYTVQSLFWAYQQSGVLQYTIAPSVIPPKFPLQLKTSDVAWLLIAPKMVLAFPSDWIQLNAHFGEAFAVSCSPLDNSLAVTLPLALDVQPITSSGAVTAFTVGCPLKASLRLKIATQVFQNGTSREAITGSLEYVTCNLTVTNSSVGTVKIGALAGLVNWVLPGLVLPFANTLLAEGFPLPSVDGVSLANSTVAFRDNYVVFASDLDVNASALPFGPPALRHVPVDLGTIMSGLQGVHITPPPAVAAGFVKPRRGLRG